jgi:hypothetical protein
MESGQFSKHISNNSNRCYIEAVLCLATSSLSPFVQMLLKADMFFILAYMYCDGLWPFARQRIGKHIPEVTQSTVAPQLQSSQHFGKNGFVKTKQFPGIREQKPKRCYGINSTVSEMTHS